MKKMNLKLVTALLAVVLVAGLAGCTGTLFAAGLCAAGVENCNLKYGG